MASRDGAERDHHCSSISRSASKRCTEVGVCNKSAVPLFGKLPGAAFLRRRGMNSTAIKKRRKPRCALHHAFCSPRLNVTRVPTAPGGWHWPVGRWRTCAHLSRRICTARSTREISVLWRSGARPTSRVHSNKLSENRRMPTWLSGGSREPVI